MIVFGEVKTILFPFCTFEPQFQLSSRPQIVKITRDVFLDTFFMSRKMVFCVPGPTELARGGQSSNGGASSQFGDYFFNFKYHNLSQDLSYWKSEVIPGICPLEDTHLHCHRGQS